MPSITRRRALAVLGTAGSGALAGCASLREPAEPTLEYQLTADRIDDIAARALWRPPELDNPLAAVRQEAWEAVTDGERYTTYGYEPLPEEYTERDGEYFHLDTFVTGGQPIRRPILRLEWVGDVDELDQVPEYVRREDLSGLDEGAVMSAFFAARARENGGDAPRKLIEDGGHVYRFLDRGESDLAPEPEHDHVRVHDTILSVSVSRERLVEPAHTATATRVATDREAFADIADAKLVDERLDASALSESGGDLLRRAEADQGYAEETPLSEPFEALLRALGLETFLGEAARDGDLNATNRNVLSYGEEYYEYGLYVNDVD